MAGQEGTDNVACMIGIGNIEGPCLPGAANTSGGELRGERSIDAGSAGD